MGDVLCYVVPSSQCAAVISDYEAARQAELFNLLDYMAAQAAAGEAAAAQLAAQR